MPFCGLSGHARTTPGGVDACQGLIYVIPLSWDMTRTAVKGMTVSFEYKNSV